MGCLSRPKTPTPTPANKLRVPGGSIPVADPDLQIRGGGGGGGSHPDPEIRGAVSHFGREIRGGPGPPGPSPGSATGYLL